MNKHVVSLIGIAAFGAFSLAAQAQSHSPSHSGGHSAAAPSQAAATELTEAEVRKVDKENKKITLKHGPIKNLDMPAMTMVFNVNDSSMLEKVQAGDKVRFAASGDGGKFTLTQLQPAK